MELYAKVAMDAHKPVPSEKKKEELKKIVDALTKNKSRIEKPRYYDPEKLPLKTNLPYNGNPYANTENTNDYRPRK